MSKVLQEFAKKMKASGGIKKFFQRQTPGNRIWPAKNTESELRLDAGETKDNKKRVYVQVNSEAKNEALKKWRKKHTTHGNLAVFDVDLTEPAETQEATFDEIWEDVSEEAKNNLNS